ncbi:MAG: Hsp20/alpha crystallin family protein [Candidatus Undinarchaeales archaeon]
MAKKSKKEKEDNWWRKYTKGYLENAENSGKSKSNEKSKQLKREESSSEPEYFDPFEQMEIFSRQMDKMFGNMFKSSFGPGIPRVLKMKEGKFRRPRANVKEKEDKIFVAVELPGMNKEDIKTKVEGRNLIIDARKKSESRKEEENFSEFRSGYNGYRHVIRLPSEVEKEKSKAKFENGILKVILQKKESDEGPSDIDIE